MDNSQLNTERTERRLERIVLFVLSIYTVASFATGLLSGWSIYIRELLFLPTISGWFIYLGILGSPPPGKFYLRLMLG